MRTSKDSNVWNGILDIANINEHVHFISNLIDKYQWDSDIKKVMENQLRLIKQKQNDKCLNISVIGEFSAGKSTLINALLRTELLVSSALQGTTVTNTIIEYSSTPFIKIFLKKGRELLYRYQQIADVKNALPPITTDPVDGKHIDFVLVGIPSSFLHNNIRIIDTPGTNSLETWHEETTKRALSEMSDISLILTAAEKPLPTSLIDFCHENLSNILNRSILLATRFDLVPKRERSGMMEYIRKKAASDLCVKSMPVLPMSPAAILDQILETNIVRRDKDEMISVTSQSIQDIVDYTAQTRQGSQINKLLVLISNAFDILSSPIEEKIAVCDSKIRLLKKSRTTSLAEFVAKQKIRLRESFSAKVSEIRSTLNDNIEKEISRERSKIENHIKVLNSLEDIKSHMNDKFVGECGQAAQGIAKCNTSANLILAKSFREIIECFQRAFESEFKRLKILEFRFTKSTASLPVLEKSSISNFKEAVNFISDSVSNENWAFGSGAAAGAAIGTMIAPGIGTVVGGFLGFIAGGMMAPDKDKIKNQTLAKLNAPLNSFFCTVQADLLHAFDTNTDYLFKSIDSELDKYLQQYLSAVNSQIKRQQTELEKINRESQSIRSDLMQIEAHRQQLRQISSKINV